MYPYRQANEGKMYTAVSSYAIVNVCDCCTAQYSGSLEKSYMF